MKYSAKSGTSNALAHAKKHETTQNIVTVDKFMLKRKATISAIDKAKLINAGVDMVSKDLRPFASIQGEGMIDFSHTLWNLGAKYGAVSNDEMIDIMPCPQAIGKNVRIKAKVKKDQMHGLLLKAVEYSPFIAITCDVWQDNYKRISYLGVTAHFYSEDLKLCDQVIALKPLDWNKKKDHAFIKQTVRDVIETCKIPFDKNKIIFITDRGSNMKKALKDFIRLNCFPHFVNNVAKESCKIDIIKNNIAACGDLVRFMKISGHNNQLEKSLKSSSPTRFNSVLATVDSIIENWDQLEIILMQENETERLDKIDKTVLLQMKSFLQPLKQWSDFTESSHKSSLYAVWLGIDSLIKHCTVKDGDEHIITLMKTKALCYIEKRFELHSFHRISTFLHPNYKNLRFASESMIQCTVNETKELLQKYEDSRSIPASCSAQDRRSSGSSVDSVNSELSNYLNDFVDEDEVDKYQRLNFMTDMDIVPAIWWHEKRQDFPCLSKLAIAIHGLPASSTPSERCFSVSGAIITDKRSSLDPNAIEDLLILRSGSQKFATNSIWQSKYFFYCLNY